VVVVVVVVVVETHRVGFSSAYIDSFFPPSFSPSSLSPSLGFDALFFPFLFGCVVAVYVSRALARAVGNNHGWLESIADSTHRRRARWEVAGCAMYISHTQVLFDADSLLPAGRR